MKATPTVAQLRAFVAVAEHQHFRDAAAALGRLAAHPEPVPGRDGAAARRPADRAEPAQGARHRRRPVPAAAGQDGRRRGRRIPGRRPSGHLAERPAAPRRHPHDRALPAALDPARRSASRRPTCTCTCTRTRPTGCSTRWPRGRSTSRSWRCPSTMRAFTAEPLYDEDFVLAVPSGHPWAGAADVSAGQPPRRGAALPRGGSLPARPGARGLPVVRRGARRRHERAGGLAVDDRAAGVGRPGHDVPARQRRQGRDPRRADRRRAVRRPGAGPPDRPGAPAVDDSHGGVRGLRGDPAPGGRGRHAVGPQAG